MDLKNKRSLVAYFSRKGNNYVDGNVVDLPVGNTEVAARFIQEITGCDMFHIDTVQAYPKNYKQTTEVAQKELQANARPELIAKVENMEQYDVIFLGYPNWWGTTPMAVWTFLEAYDFSQKVIFPFCTHEGSGLGRSERDIKKLCPGALLENGLAIRGSKVNNSKNDIQHWIDK